MSEKLELRISAAVRGKGTGVVTAGFGLLLLLGAVVSAYPGQVPDSPLRSEFHVKYVAAGTVYLDKGKNGGLREGMKLQVRHAPPANASPAKPAAPPKGNIAQIRVLSVSLVSAVCEVVSSTDEIKPGDAAVLEEAEIEKATKQEELGSTRKYPQIISFTESNPLDEEARAFVPRPPLPEVNRARGMIGFNYGGLSAGGPAAINTTQIGGFLRADITRIGGTYWGMSGYWRGNLNTAGGTGRLETINDLINRTYHLQMTYNNPNSHWVAGFGRLYLPWAVSLNTIDGGYFGRRVAPHTIVGLFAGSTPDPTSWNYAPNRHLGGTFVNFSGGSFDSFRYSSTEGIGLDTLRWSAKREFLFTDNMLSYKNFFSVYHALQYERPQIPGTNGTYLPGLTGLSRSFLTVRVQPHPRVSFEFNDNYFRDLPTFDFALISTGFVDQLLFQGFSVGAHVEVVKGITVYNDLGKSSGTGDAHGSWNQMYGITLDKIWKTGLHADARYSEFNSSFGRGKYTALTLSRNFRDTLQWQFLAGKQNMVSTLTQNSNFQNVGTTLDWFPTRFPMYFSVNLTREQGTVMNYNQWYIGIGYRFDNKTRHRAR